MKGQIGPEPGAAESEASRDDGATPVANRIRDRIRKANTRFHANDSIAAFIEEGELDQLQLEVAAKMGEVLRALVIDTESDHNTQDTARRVAKIYLKEVFAGRYKDMNSKMTNSVMRGSFLKNPDLRREFLSLLTDRND